MTLFDLFFTTQIPEHLRYRSFTWPHLVLLMAVAACGALAVRHMRRLEAPRRERMLRAFAWAVPGMYLIRFCVFLALDLLVEPQMSFLDRLPFQLCSLNSIVIPLAVQSRNKTLMNYIYAISMPGAAAAMLTPAMSYYGKYFYFGWQVVFFFFDHGLMALVAILAISGGLLRPDFRRLPRVLLIFFGYAAVLYPINKLTGENFLFINYPDEGTVMAFFARYFGNPGYLAPMLLLVLLLVILLYLPWLLSDRRNV